jgi:outer membrane lipoprotein SlyB
MVATGAGAVLGGVAGHAVQNRAKNGVEYTVKLDSGETITLAQGAEPKLSAGQRVYVVNSNKGRSRIVPE